MAARRPRIVSESIVRELGSCKSPVNIRRRQPGFLTDRLTEFFNTASWPLRVVRVRLTSRDHPYLRYMMYKALKLSPVPLYNPWALPVAPVWESADLTQHDESPRTRL